MNENNDVYEAVAIKDGKIVEVGPERQILNKYSADEYIDAELKDVYPGFTDAHAHILSYARQKLSVDIVGCKSYDEMIERIESYQKKYKRNFIIGRGWDQSMWSGDEMPSNRKLNELYPDIPVCLFRIDGHALLANDLLINKSDVFEKVANDEELSNGGYFVHNANGDFEGVMVDNAMNPILDILPDFGEQELIQAIIEVQDELLAYGVTGVHEAGMQSNEVQLFEKMIKNDQLKLNIYGMLLPSEENIAFARKNGIYQNKNLSIRSFKVYGDGAMGSRGAFLKNTYTDAHDHQGYLVTSEKNIRKIARICEETNYQMNTHAIGDSTNRLLLDIYKGMMEVRPDHRWRIEHAQVVSLEDIPLFAQSGAFPSVQPTHATSDMRWAESRLGSDRMPGAYAYKSILQSYGMMALGTDFPVELTNPFLTIQSAVNRKNKDNEPSNGFQNNEAITLNECLKGMTIWAAISAFQEKELGTIEAGKDATIIILENSIGTDAFRENFAIMTLIKGKKVYSVE
jgi:predicted amidohydrolase YtcJ